MCTPTVTERTVALEPLTRDDFADSPASATASAERRPVHPFIPDTSGERPR